ncbi:unnamed protein product [Sphagnum jensenii]|uniref:Uncharacterized protein n=1 Tax=Sphagnum jensenii TaxID=128206 RepID=A0ABP1B8W1_9BRYO
MAAALRETTTAPMRAPTRESANTDSPSTIFTLDYHATRATIAAPLLSSSSSSSKSSTSRFFFFNSHQSSPLPLSTSKATANPP